MRVMVLVIVAACSFEHGTAKSDAVSEVGSDGMMMGSDSGSNNACSTTGLICVNAVVVDAIDCNGACWAKCQSNSPITQPQANTACASWGGKLAPIRGLDDEICVSNALFPVQASWIGFEQTTSAGSPDVGWSWNGDSAPVGFINWDSGQPDDANGNENDHAEQCAMMNTGGFWHDVPCGNLLYRFSCRR